MPTLLLFTAHLALHALFLWGMQAVFRKQHPTPGGVRLIVAASAASIAVGAGCIAGRGASQAGLDAVALLMVATAAALFVSGVHTIGCQRLRAAFSHAGPDALVTDGPFRWLRHPFYAAYLLGHAVPLAASRNLWALPGLLLMAAVYGAAVRDEERRFRAGPLSAAWCRYAARTGCFLPRPAALWRALRRDPDSQPERTRP